MDSKYFFPQYVLINNKGKGKIAILENVDLTPKEELGTCSHTIFPGTHRATKIES